MSHDGSKIVYISTETVDTSGNIVIDGELYTIPWNDRKGGPATPLTGANQAASRQYYPCVLVDDALVAFDRAPIRSGTRSYDDAQGGSTSSRPAARRATRLANDPPACSGSKSPARTTRGRSGRPTWGPTTARSTLHRLLVLAQQQRDEAPRRVSISRRSWSTRRATSPPLRALSLEPAGDRGQPLARVGHAPHSDEVVEVVTRLLRRRPSLARDRGSRGRGSRCPPSSRARTSP